MRKEKCTAIVLAAGKGSRMGTKIRKQYLEVEGKPVIYYSLRVFEDSAYIDEIVLVTSADEIDYCQNEIVDKFGFHKVKRVVAGGAERYESVFLGLCSAENDGTDYVFIHDGARPFVDEEMLQRAYHCVRDFKACVIGMPVKDTIKIVDDDGIVVETPERKKVWQIQTPQVFLYNLIKESYHKMMEHKEKSVTDDAMVVELYGRQPVKLVEGTYENLKITTPEDLEIAEKFLKKRKKNIDKSLL